MSEDSNNWTIVTYDRSYLKAMTAFLESQHRSDVDKGNLGESYYEWKLHDTPGGDGTGGLAVAKDNRVVGSTTANMKPFFFHGKRVVVAELGDSFTDPEFRRQGILTRVSDRARKEVSKGQAAVMYGTPNELSVGGYMKQGYVQPDWFGITYWVRPQRFSTLLKRRLPGFLAMPVAGALRVGASATSLVLAPRPGRNTTWRYVNELPDDVDRIWESGSKRFDLVRVRDTETLEWRFRKGGRLQYEYLLCEHNGSPIGYAVTATIVIKGLRVLMLADYFFSGETDWARATAGLFYFLSHDRRHDLVGTWLLKSQAFDAGTFPTSSQMLRLGFLPMKSVNLFFDPELMPPSYLDTPFKFHFTISDSDNI